MIHGDSWDYHLITKGVELSKDVEGACVEIGLRMGGGTMALIDELHRLGIREKPVVAIDPYGSILYEHKEKHFVRLDYTEDMKADCLSELYPYAKEKKVPFYFINMSDTDFFDYYEKGIPIYNVERHLINKYSFVHFDGPHSLSSIMLELDYFIMRIDKGACFCFDDVSKVDVYYDHDKIEEFLLLGGFKLIDKTDKKALYQYEDESRNSRHNEGSRSYEIDRQLLSTEYIANSSRSGRPLGWFRNEDTINSRISENY